MAFSWTSRPPGPSSLPSFELLLESDGITGLDSMEGNGRGLRGSTTSKLHHTHSQVLKHKRNTAKGPPPVQPSPSFQHVPGAFSRPLLAGEGLGRSVLVIVKLKNRGIVWLGQLLAQKHQGNIPPRSYTLSGKQKGQAASSTHNYPLPSRGREDTEEQVTYSQTMPLNPSLISLERTPLRIRMGMCSPCSWKP